MSKINAARQALKAGNKATAMNGVRKRASQALMGQPMHGPPSRPIVHYGTADAGDVPGMSPAHAQGRHAANPDASIREQWEMTQARQPAGRENLDPRGKPRRDVYLQEKAAREAKVSQPQNRPARKRSNTNPGEVADWSRRGRKANKSFVPDQPTLTPDYIPNIGLADQRRELRNAASPASSNAKKGMLGKLTSQSWFGNAAMGAGVGAATGALNPGGNDGMIGGALGGAVVGGLAGGFGGHFMKGVEKTGMGMKISGGKIGFNPAAGNEFSGISHAAALGVVGGLVGGAKSKRFSTVQSNGWAQGTANMHFPGGY